MWEKYFEFKDFADRRTLDAVAKLSANTDSFNFALQQINHMVIVEELFKARILAEPEPHCSTNTRIVPTLSQLHNRKIELNQWYSGFLATTDKTQLDSEIRFVFKDGKMGKMTVSEVLFHLLSHGSYHRGNIAHALDLAGVPHPVDGFAMYLHQSEPERRN